MAWSGVIQSLVLFEVIDIVVLPFSGDSRAEDVDTQAGVQTTKLESGLGDYDLNRESAQEPPPEYCGAPKVL